MFTHEHLASVPTFDRIYHGELLSNINISQNEVYQKLKGLKVNKSPGPDGLHPRILKETACITCLPLTIIFWKSLSTTVVPDDWKLANVVPIFKKGEHKKPGNYRPISLTSVVAKLPESII